MKTFNDFFKWYYNLDVLPFIEAFDKMKEFCTERKRYIFKDGLSLLGLVLKYYLKAQQVSSIYLIKNLK